MTRAASATAAQGRCRACKSALVSDSGEVVCSRCGIVVDYQLSSLGPDVHGSAGGGSGSGLGAGEKPAVPRASGVTTVLHHDMGITTDISPTPTDYAGRRLAPETASQMTRLRKSHKHMRTATSKDRRLADVLASIRGICDAASLTDSVGRTAAIEYRRMAKRVNLKGTSVVGMAAASVYTACKKHGAVRTIEELCRGVCSSDDEAAKKSRLAGRCYRNMAMEMNSEAGKSAPAVPVSLYISKAVNVSGVDVRVVRLALQLAEMGAGSEDFSGKMPHGVAAAYLYIAAILLGQPMAQRDIAGASGVAEVTIRSRCREVIEGRQVRAVLEPAPGGDGRGRDKGRGKGRGRGRSGPPSAQSRLFGFGADGS